MNPFLRLVLLSVAAAVLSVDAIAQTAEWIWHKQPATPAAGEVRYFRRPFTIVGKLIKAELSAACDDQCTVFLNGKEVGASPEWKRPLKRNVTGELRGGENMLAIRGKNDGGVAGVVAVLDIEQEYGKRQVIVTDSTWQSASDVPPGWERLGTNTGSFAKVASIAKLGAGPWGNVFEMRTAATPAKELTVPAGFKVELLRSAAAGEGSWVCMAVDDKGRLYISPQGKEDMLRASLTAEGQVQKIEPIELPVTGAMGMLWAFDSLYVSGEGPDGQAIYRLRDTDRDDVLDEAKLFKKVPGGAGEHGAHAIVLGPDNKLYIAHGNSTPLVDGIAPDSPYRNYAEDYLLSRVLDPVATFFDKLKIPYGHVLRTDADGKKWELFAGGFRNQYDIDFNKDGELFTFDSDMEWDVGLPWYRPTRILHVTSGAEFGFREGSTKWPDYYPDSLPTVVDVGLGSPTGVKFGTRSNFPDKYRRALFAMDWTYGRILAVHLEANGASYSGKYEDFVKGKGLPVSDLEFGKDGAMYFTVGGRGTQAGLYRVSWSGPDDSNASSKESSDKAPAARDTRRELERFHGRADASAVTAAWPRLGDPDRHLRFAARLAIESQPIAQWQERALNESDPQAALTGLLALARVGEKSVQEPLLKALAKFPLDSLDAALKLEKLRVIELGFIRHGRPAEELVKLAIEKLSKQYPAATYPLNRELSQLLVWLAAPDVVGKTLDLLAKATKQEEQIWYAYVLREAKEWTPEQRQTYFAWFLKARDYKGGNSFTKFIGRIREFALANVPEPERKSIAALSDAALEPAKPRPPVPPRQFQKAWTVDDLAGDLDKVSTGRNFARGKEVFSSTQCLQCHHFNNEGGNVGPDITAAASRFNRRDLLETIINPSKAISEQYASYIITTKKGDAIVGLIVDQNNDHTAVVTDLLAGTRQLVPRGLIASKELSPVSLMPPGLLNVLTKEEILDLLAYIESGGNEKSKHFTAPK